MKREKPPKKTWAERHPPKRFLACQWTDCSKCKMQIRWERMWRIQYSWCSSYLFEICSQCAPNRWAATEIQLSLLDEYTKSL